MVYLAVLAQITSTVSVLGSFVAGIYQLYLGYLYEGADGLSPVLLFCWLLGDIANVIGTIWTRQLVFQQIIALASLANNLAMSAQAAYYVRKHRQARQVPAPITVGGGKYLAMRWNALLRPYIIFTLVSAARALPIGKFEDTDYVDWKYVAGQCMAWIAEVSYSLALIPQACENFSRKSTGSVSITIFGADAVASVNYLATILIAATEKPTEYAAIEFLLEELPYLCGTAVCTVLDFVLLSQYFLYPQFVVEIPIETASCETAPLLPFRSWKSYANPI